MGLCEGNHCKGGAEGKDKGNGRIVLAQLGSTASGECVWETTKIISIPPRADFTDYSAFAFAPDPASSKVAVLSQADAKVWVRSGRWNGWCAVDGGTGRAGCLVAGKNAALWKANERHCPRRHVLTDWRL